VRTPATPVPVAATGNNSTFVLRSPEVTNGGNLPVDYTGDGTGSTLPLEWSGAPAGTKSYALLMHHLDPEGVTKSYWILYNIPSNLTSLPKNVKGVGSLGASFKGAVGYEPPHSKGPGAKTYVLTLYALSAAAEVTGPPAQVTYAKMLEAMKGKVLASTDLSVVYTRNVGSGGESETPSPGVPTAGKDPQGGPGAPQGGPGTGQGVPGNVGANRPQAGNGGLRLLPGGAREKLKLTAEQQKQLEDLEVELKSRIERILTPDQLEQLKQMRPPPRDGDAADARPNRPHPNP
jgi:phosphatidylethanolamine-binding protein (PEBP) family uncharacterized protein